MYKDAAENSAASESTGVSIVFQKGGSHRKSNPDGAMWACDGCKKVYPFFHWFLK